MDPPEPKAGRVTARSTAVTLVFVAVIQLAALYFTQVNLPVTSQVGYSYAPAGTSSTGSAWNAIILVLVVFATTMVAVWLVKKRRVKVFKFIVFAGAAFALFLLTLLTAADVTSAYLNSDTALYFSLGAAVGVVVLLALATYSSRAASVAPIATGLLSAEVGSYFASTIPYLTAILVPIAFAVYDIYAVFKGPLRQLITLASSDSLGTVSTKVGDLTLGVGDTVFYSMIPSIVLFQFNVGYALVTMLAVDAGVIVTLYLLNRVRLLPGLPIPVALGLFTLLIYTLHH